MNATERADAIVRAITACTHPDASSGAHAYRDGICRCGAPKRNPDGSVPLEVEPEEQAVTLTRDETIAAFQKAHPWCTDPTIPGDCFDRNAAIGIPWCGECCDWHHPCEEHSQP